MLLLTEAQFIDLNSPVRALRPHVSPLLFPLFFFPGRAHLPMSTQTQTHSHTDTNARPHRGRQGPLPTHIFVVNEPLSGAGGSVDFWEDRLGTTCLHFGLCSHFNGNSWAEFRFCVGCWASPSALSQQRQGPQTLSGNRGTGQVGPQLGLTH